MTVSTPDLQPQTPWFSLSKDDCLARLSADPEQGLTTAEANARLKQYGPNALVSESSSRVWQILLQQFTEPLVVVLLIATVISAALWAVEGERHEPLPYDAIVILAIVILNAVLGFVQEFRAERAVEALKQLSAPDATVRRDGQRMELASEALVPGDILLLEAGDRVLADARLIRTASLEADEAALTGESVQVNKWIDPVTDMQAELGDQRNMVFSGTVITYGNGEAVVTATGMASQMGRIATLLQSVEHEETPLQRELAIVGKQLGILVLIICAIVAVAGILKQGALNADVVLSMFLFAVALAVAAIPEGLPAVVTAVLALGVQRMAKRNAIVRRLPAVETLGSATVVCSDKTGTLTRNEMTVRKALLGTDWVLDVDGEGYMPQGDFHPLEGVSMAETRPDLECLMRVAALNNDADLQSNDERLWRVQGDPTEGALLVAARKAGLAERVLRQSFPRLGEIPFSSERKRMTTIHQLDDVLTALVKGAPDVVIDLCSHIRVQGDILPLTPERKSALLAQNESFAGSALRTLAFASRPLPEQTVTENADYEAGQVEKELIWEGLIGMIDPPRTEARASVATAKQAGIDTKMITGDHALTAMAIARELGITDHGTEVITGRQLSEMTDDQLANIVPTTDVFARVNPEHKLRVIRALKTHRDVVAMTGDGVNDAPALKQADIGVAMGITGTDVSKEASDMVLADDNFATIVAAISEGRTIFNNIRKFIRYLLSSNMGEVLTMFVGILAADILALSTGDGELFLPLTAVQILWINLVTDGGPALALGVDPSNDFVMQQKPRSPGTPVIDRAMWVQIVVVGVVMMIGTLFVLDGYLPGGLVELIVFDTGSEHIHRHARTAAFTTLMMFQMFNVFNCRSQRYSLFKIGPFTNRWLLLAVAVSILLHMVVIYWPPFQGAFETVPLSGFDWMVATLVSSSVLIVIELMKRLNMAGEDALD